MAAEAMSVRAFAKTTALMLISFATISFTTWAASPFPHALQPAVTVPGGSMTVQSIQQGLPVVLAGPADVALQASWAESAVNGIEARCVVPTDAAPGRYDLIVGEERREGAVWVLESIPASYRIAFVSGHEPAGLVQAATAAVEAEALGLVFIGADADAAPYRAAARETTLPVWVTGVGDRSEWPFAFAAAIGQDTLLFHDPRVTKLGAGSGELHRLRRATRASRWTIAVSPHYDPYIGIRNQLILFADDPVDMFVAPLDRIPETPEDLPVPGFWPRVRFEPIVAGAADALLVVQFSSAPLRSARISVPSPPETP